MHMPAYELRQFVETNERDMVKFMDMAKERWGAKLIGLALQIDGKWYGRGALAPRRTSEIPPCA